MTYQTSNPPRVETWSSDGAKPTTWTYASEHTMRDLAATAFFTDATNLGMRVEDIIFAQQNVEPFDSATFTVFDITDGEATLSRSRVSPFLETDGFEGNLVRIAANGDFEPAEIVFEEATLDANLGTETMFLYPAAIGAIHFPDTSLGWGIQRGRLASGSLIGNLSDAAQDTLSGRTALRRFTMGAWTSWIITAPPFATRALAVTWLAAGWTVTAGTILFAGDLAWQASTGSTAIADMPGLIPWGKVWITHWNATKATSFANAQTVADSYAAVLACVTYVGSGEVYVPAGYYKMASSLSVTGRIMFVGMGPNTSYLLIDHLLGPGIRFYNTWSGTDNVGIRSSTARSAGPARTGNNFGLLYETEDLPDASSAQRLQYARIIDTEIYGHPCDNVHIVGLAFTGEIRGFRIGGSKGHAIAFDRGEGTGRVNLVTTLTSGICRIGEGRFDNNLGHIIAVGSPTSAFSTPACRVIVDNVEGGNNATDAAARYTDTLIYMRGANHRVMNSGLEHSGAAVFFAGRNLHYEDNRSLGSYIHSVIIGTYDELPTNGVWIKGMSHIGAAAPLNPAVLVTLPAGETIEPKNIFIEQGEMDNVTRLVATDATLGSLGPERVQRLFVNGRTPTVYKTVDETPVNNSTTLVDDSELHLYMPPNDRLAFKFLVEYSGNTTADIKMQVAGPSGCTIKFNDSPTSVKVGSASTAIVSGEPGTAVMVYGCEATHKTALIEGICTSASSGGWLKLRWAQAVATVGDTFIHAGVSSLRVERDF